MKLPKIGVVMFDRNILNWKMFWEQLDVSIQYKTQLTSVEKLAYVRYALKGGPASQAIEGYHDRPINMKKLLGVSKRVMTNFALYIKCTFVLFLMPLL